MGLLDMFKKKQVKRPSINREKKVEVEVEEEVLEESHTRDSYDEDDTNDESFCEVHKEIEEVIKREILNVAIYHDKFEELKARAKIAANNIGEENIHLLPGYLMGKIYKPNELKGKYESFGQWTMVVENSVLMIIFSFREKGVAVLTKIAYGNTSIKLKAINLLLKLAKDCICTDEIIDDIIKNINMFTDDEKIDIFTFASQIKENKKVIALIQHFYKEFLKDEDVERAYETVIHLMNVAQSHTAGHLNFLKVIAMDNKKIDLKKVMPIKDGEKEFIDIDNLDEFIKIRATLTFYNINREDVEINNKLIYLSKHHEDDKVKNEIKRIMESENIIVK